MKKYRFSKELEGKTLEYGDMLVIANIIHLVKENHLLNLQGCGNDYVFELLDIMSKEQFCQDHYGYWTKRVYGNFPFSKPDDYEALTRVSIALMKASEKQGFLPPMVYSTSEELKDKTLKLEDKILFGDLRYEVVNNFNTLYLYLEGMGSMGSVSNDYIFDVLEISDKRYFCQKYYGDNSSYSETNSFTEEDYQALTRLTIALLRLSEFKTVQNALDECSCVKEHLKTPSLIPMAEELEKILKGRHPNSVLNQKEIKMVRELFNAAEDQIHQK